MKVPARLNGWTCGKTADFEPRAPPSLVLSMNEVPRFDLSSSAAYLVSSRSNPSCWVKFLVRFSMNFSWTCLICCSVELHSWLALSEAMLFICLPTIENDRLKSCLKVGLPSSLLEFEFYFPRPATLAFWDFLASI